MSAGVAAGLPPNVRVHSTLPSDHSGYSLDDQRAVQALLAAEDRHFWQLSRNELLTERLARLGVVPPSRLLELGCGSGCVAAHLCAQGYEVTGVDGHLPLILRAAARAPRARFLVLDLANAPGPIEGEPFDAVGLFDVLEHLDAPDQALAQAVRRVRPGGVVVGTVPALMALWSNVDRDAGHRLRYERGQLEMLLREVPQAELLEVAPFNRQLVPLMWLQRRAVVKQTAGDTAEANFKVPPRPLNQGFLWLSRLERRLASRLDATPLPGASLWFALRRTA